jgi:hypothetical protein
MRKVLMRSRMLQVTLWAAAATLSGCGPDEAPLGPTAETPPQLEPGVTAQAESARLAAGSAVLDALTRVLATLPLDDDVGRLRASLQRLEQMLGAGSAIGIATAASEAAVLATDLRGRYAGDPGALLHLDLITLAIDRAVSSGSSARGAAANADLTSINSR